MSEQIHFTTGCGIKPVDERDFPWEILAAGVGELPKMFEVDIPFFYNQRQIDACVGMGTMTAKSKQEKVQLSPRFIWGLTKKAEDYVGWGTDFQSLMKQLQTVGTVPFGTINEDTTVDRDAYMRFDLTPELKAIAGKYKALSYWRPREWTSIKQALVESGVPLVTYCTWYRSFNTPSNGFLPLPSGGDVGGHLFVLKGWRVDTNGREYAVFRNSWSENWGDKGDFYVYTDELESRGIRVFFVLVDIPVEQAQIVVKYDGKLIKNLNKPEVYFVKKGKIAWIQNENVFNFGKSLGWWGDWKDIITIEQEIKSDLTI